MGGGVSQAFDLLHENIVAAFRASAMLPFHDTKIVAAMLGDNAGLAGAAALVWAKEGSCRLTAQAASRPTIFRLPQRRLQCVAPFLTRVKIIVDE